MLVKNVSNPKKYYVNIANVWKNNVIVIKISQNYKK